MVAIAGALYFTLASQTLGATAIPETSSPPPATATSLPGPTQTNFPIPTDPTLVLTHKANVRATAEAEASARPLVTPERAPTGIYDDEHYKPQWQAFGFNVENAWVGFVNGNRVTIFAGAPNADPAQGTLQVSMVLPYRGFMEAFLTADKHGALQVISEQSNRLTLEATDGNLFYFDVPAMRFVSSATEVVATMTPLPTYTPVVIPTLPAATGYPGHVTATPAP
jgi:hypothetical protein